MTVVAGGPVRRVTVVTSIAISWLSIGFPLVEVVASGLVTGLVRVGVSWMALVDVVTVRVRWLVVAYGRVRWSVRVAISWLSIGLSLVDVVASDSGLATVLVRASISWMALVNVVTE